MDERTKDGRFAPGNPGGPGRPRRVVERDYLAILSEAVTMEAWRAIVDAAIKQALDGDDKARSWLSKYCLGENPSLLIDLAAQEAANVTTEDIIAQQSIRTKLRIMKRNQTSD